MSVVERMDNGGKQKKPVGAVSKCISLLTTWGYLDREVGSMEPA